MALTAKEASKEAIQNVPKRNNIKLTTKETAQEAVQNLYRPARRLGLPISEIYPIDQLFKNVRYLVQIEDRIPPGFFIDGRPTFKMIISFYRQILKWKSDGYKFVKLIYWPGSKYNIYQPYYQYYLWTDRLYNLINVVPIK